ncbi:MAG: hypothetical protein ACRDHC_08145 [Actinomycetota bacterium]
MPEDTYADIRSLLAEAASEIPALTPAPRWTVRRARRRAAATVSFGLLALAFAVVVATPAIRAFRTSVPVVPGDFGRIESRIPTGDLPTSVAVGYGSVWVANTGDATLVRIDPATEEILARIDLGDIPVAPYEGELVLPYADLQVEADASAVWVLATRTEELIRVDPVTNSVVARIPVPAGQVMDAGAGAIWVTQFNGSVMRVDPVSDDIVARIRTGPRPLGVHASAGAVWVVDDVAGTLTRIDPATNDVVAKVRTGANLARGVAADRSAAWAVGCVARDGSRDPRVDPRDCDWAVLVVDARTNELALTIPLFVEGGQAGPPAPTSGGWPFDVLAVGEGGVWAVPYTPICANDTCPDEFLLRIDPATGATATMEVGTGTIDAAVLAGEVWVVVRNAGELVRIDLNA